VICRVLPIGDRFYSTSSKLQVLQVDWHPQTSATPHLVALSNDNNLRIFDLESNHKGCFPEQTLALGGSSARSSVGGKVSLLKLALGDTAVAYAFGPSLDEGMEQVWPVFLLHGDGTVHLVLTGLGDHAIYQPHVSGPLEMQPECDENYGTDTCAILCLSPAPSAPPILAVATEKGTIYHFVVLGDIYGGCSGEEVPPTLYAYESVELEAALFSEVGSEEESAAGLDCPIHLTIDPVVPGLRYLCHHRSGVHCVALPMAAQLAEVAMSGEDDASHIVGQAQEDSIVEYLVCTRLDTKVKSSHRANPVVGVAVAVQKLTANLVAMFSDCTFEILKMTSESYFPKPVAVESTRSKSGDNNKVIRKESFDQHIAKMLQRTTSHPLVHSDSSMQMSGEELLNLLTKTTQTLHDEYLTRLEKARSEIHRKVEILESKKRQQQGQLIKLRGEKKGLTSKAAALSETYQDLQDNNGRLSSRLESILSKIQDQQTVRSDSELKMQRALVEIGRKMNDLDNRMTQIKTKEKYQLRQIRESEDTRLQGQDQSGLEGGGRLALSHKQLQSIKEVLQANSQDLADIVKQLNGAKKDLCA